MLKDIVRAKYFHPSSLLYEMLILKEIQKNSYSESPKGSKRELSDIMIQGYIEQLKERGYLKLKSEQGLKTQQVTEEGEKRLRILMIDYVQELMSLYGDARDIFRKRMAELYLNGIRKIAFYPIGETAEVIYNSMSESGITLSLAVDDDPLKWNAEFHGINISPPETLSKTAIDGVLLTTCIFQVQIRNKLTSMGMDPLKILSL